MVNTISRDESDRVRNYFSKEFPEIMLCLRSDMQKVSIDDELKGALEFVDYLKEVNPFLV